MPMEILKLLSDDWFLGYSNRLAGLERKCRGEKGNLIKKKKLLTNYHTRTQHPYLSTQLAGVEGAVSE